MRRTITMPGGAAAPGERVGSIRRLGRRGRPSRPSRPGRYLVVLVGALVTLSYQAISTPLVEVPPGSAAWSAGAGVGVVAGGQRDDVEDLGYAVAADDEGGVAAVAVVGLAGGRADELAATRALGTARVVGLDGAEARQRLARSDERYDIIELALTDSADATSSGARALAPAPVFTTEAWHTFLDRLGPGGVVSVSRWYRIDGRQSLEPLRATALAAQVLHERGAARPRDHILLYEGAAGTEGDSVATLLVSPDPFGAARVGRVAAVAARRGLTAIVTPRGAADARFGALLANRGPREAIAAEAPDVSPPTDDRPYFFQMADPGNALRFGWPDDDPAFAPMWTLLVVAPVLTVAVAGTGPLLRGIARARRPRRPAARSGSFGATATTAGVTPAPSRLPRSHVVSLCATGAGLAFVAHPLVERVGVLVGRPSTALGAVLGALLLAGAAGARLGRIVGPALARTDLLALPSVGVSVLVVGCAVVLPPVMEAGVGSTTTARVGVCIALLAPLAVGMGMTFPAAMADAGEVPGVPLAPLRALGAASTVAAWTGAMAIVILTGVTTTLLIGGLAYAVAACGLWFAVPERSDGASAHVLQGSPD